MKIWKNRNSYTTGCEAFTRLMIIKTLNLKNYFFTEGSNLLLNSAMNVNKEIRFHNLLPVSLSGIDFDSTNTDLSPRIATATFALIFTNSVIFPLT